MSTFILNQQDCFNMIDPSAESNFREYSCFSTGTEDLALPSRSLTGLFQAAPDPGVSYAPCISNENSLGLYETCTSESDWTASVGYPSATSTPNQTDAQIFNASFLPAFDSGVQHLWQPHTHQLTSESDETALSDIGHNFVRQSPRTIALPGSLRAQKPKARSQRHASRSLQSASTLSRGLLRHTPYSVGSERTRQCDPPMAYQCQWFDGTPPCGTQVLASRHAIGQHLHTMHTIQPKADKTLQICHWERCRKSMRKESIARHILEVHMQDKVLCPTCGSTFARADSMQRHQRTHCRDNGDASTPLYHG